MLSFLLRRISLAVVSIWLIATVTFFIAFLAPGDPATLRFGEKSNPAAVQAFRHVHGLDLPPLLRYEHYMTGVLHGNFGSSLMTDETVDHFFERSFPNTALLASLAMCLGLSVGIIVGIAAALFVNTWIDRALMGLVLVGVGVPNFVLAPILVLIFAIKLNWLPVTWIQDDPISLLLPTLVLAARPAALIARMTRSSLIETMRQDFIRTARAKGLSPARIVLVHGLKNAFLPVLTTAGTAFGYLLSGSFVVETAFTVPGVGYQSIQSVLQRDYSMIQGTTILLAAIFVTINLIVDILYAFLDPRTRAGSQGFAGT